MLPIAIFDGIIGAPLVGQTLLLENMDFMQQFYKTGFGALLLFFVTACNPNSDAMNVLQSQNTSFKATISYYQETLAPTLTAQPTVMMEKMATMQSDLATARALNRDLTSKLNASVPAAGATLPPAGQSAVNNNAQPGTNNAGAQTTPTGFSFGRVVTARAKDANGCAINESTAFTANDNAIWVVAQVFNFKHGTTFTAKWSGGDFSHDNDWTVPNDGTQICVHFYIEPKTLALKNGNYTVTISTPDLAGAPVQFTYTGADTAVSTSDSSASPK